MTARPRMDRDQPASTRPEMPWRQLPLLAALLLALIPLSSLAHGGGLELTLSPNNLAAGDEVAVSGEGFAADAPVELHLTGPNGDAHLGDITAADDGDFSQTVRVPADVVPGLYLIRAAGDDQEATAELTVGAMAGMADPSTESVPTRDRSPAWRAIAIAVFLGVGFVGIAFARAARPRLLARPSV